MRKIIGVVALVAGFVLVASPPPVYADEEILITLNGPDGFIAGGGSDGFGTTTVGSPISRNYTFTSGPCNPPFLTETITNIVYGSPAGFTFTSADATEPFECGQSRSFTLRCDALAEGDYAGFVEFSVRVNIIDPAGSFGAVFYFTASCQVNAAAAAPPAAETPAEVTPASVAPATKKKPTLPTVGSSPVLPLTATLMVGLGAIAIRLARRPQPLNNR